MQTACIIVTFRPNLARLMSAITSLLDENNRIIIVDNTPENEKNIYAIKKIAKEKNATYIGLKKNMGIAHAQNKGIRIALKSKIEFILLSDQDTIYPDNFTKKIIQKYNEAKSKDPSIAAIGPAHHDINKPNVDPFFIKYTNGYQEQISRKTGTMRISQLIASGTLIYSGALKKIGKMREDLFIDWVDMEWCWRAQNLGYNIYGTFDIIINHQLGDQSKKLWKKTITIHSPFRNYFIIRNGIYLATRGISLDRYQHRWKTLKSVIIFTICIFIIQNNRLENIKMTYKAIFDALKGKLGALE